MAKQKLSFLDLKKKINYNNIDLLKKFVSNQNRILPRYINNVSEQQQRKLSKAIKKARILSLILPIHDNFL